MTSIINVLSESFQLLKERPALFTPKLVSTLAGALWFVGFFSSYGPLGVYLVTSPLIAVSGIFSAVMLAVMVKNEDSENILREGFLGALKRWKGLVLSTLILTVAVFLVFVPVTAGFMFFYFTGSLLVFSAGVLASIVLLVATSFLVYFFPISLVEKDSVLHGFWDSSKTAVGNSKEVMALTMFSFGLLVFASLVSDQHLQVLGYASFVAMRVVSGIITTYIFVVSPKYYLS